MKLILFLIINSYALSFFPRKERPPQKRPQQKASLKRGDRDALILENTKLKKLLDLKFSSPTILIPTSADLKSGSIINGNLALSVLSTNLLAPIKVNLTSTNFPEDSYAICTGASAFNRIHGNCTQIITPENTYEISATLLNRDGSAGIVGEVYTGKEEYIAGVIATSAATAILAISSESITTTSGNLLKDTSGNKLKAASISSLDEINSLMKEEMSSKTPKVFAPKNTIALLFIHSFKPLESK